MKEKKKKKSDFLGLYPSSRPRARKRRCRIVRAYLKQWRRYKWETNRERTTIEQELIPENDSSVQNEFN